MDPVSITSLLSFGKDTIEVISKIYKLFKAIREAPKKLRRLAEEVEVLREILNSIADACDQIRSAKEEVSNSVGESCKKALNFVQDQANCLYAELLKYETPASTCRWRVWRASLDMVIGDKRIVEYMGALERGKCLLVVAQANLQLHITTRQKMQIDCSAQKLEESIKLNSAVANYCLMHAKIPPVPHARLDLNMPAPTTVALPEKKRNDDQKSLSSIRQDLAEFKPAVSSLMAPPLSLAHIEPQLLLQTVLAQAVNVNLTQGERTASNCINWSNITSMSSPGRHDDRAQLCRSRRLYTSFTIHQQYSQSRVSYKKAVCLSSLLGTITITQQSRVSRSLDRRDEELKINNVSQTTAIQFTPAPWLTNTGYILSLQKELTYACSSHISMALQPVRYTSIPKAAFIEIRRGNLATLQQLLATGQLSLHDRVIGTVESLSLLEISIDAISWVWLFNEDAIYSEGQVHMINVIRTARWILARGTSADTQCQDAFLPTSWDFCHMRGTYSSDEIEQMEQLLIEVSENESPASRCQRLISFAMSNPEHSLYVDCIISDMAMEDYTDGEMLSVSYAEEQYWAKGKIFDRGQETVILHALIRLKREFRQRQPIPKTTVREILKGPRRILFEMLKVTRDIPDLTRTEQAQTARDVIDYVSSLLRVCRDLPILEDGFVDLMSAYAFEHHIRDIWDAIMSSSTGYSDGIDLEMIHLDLDTSIALFVRGDAERKVVQLEDSLTEKEGSPDAVLSFLTYFWGLVLFFLRSIV